MESNNAAALREALEELVANIEMRSSSFGLNVMVDTKTFIDAKAALAKPLRNCDRFANEAEARKAFIVWYNTVYELWGDKWNEVSSCDLKHNVDDILQEYIEWLFSPAEDTKGDNDGSK